MSCIYGGVAFLVLGILVKQFISQGLGPTRNQSIIRSPRFPGVGPGLQLYSTPVSHSQPQGMTFDESFNLKLRLQ